MHIVVIAWLFVIGVMALALASPLAGVAWFFFVGLAPVALAVALLGRRRRLRLEREVEQRDDRDAESDR
jgi:membrane protein implicated in regulation of membrane protease activity